MDLPLTYYRATCTPNDIQKVTHESYGKVGTRHAVPLLHHKQKTPKQQQNKSPELQPRGIHFTISNYFLAEVHP